MLDPRCLFIHRGVEVERTVDDAADNLAALRHLRQDRTVERRGHFGAYRFHRCQNGNFRHPLSYFPAWRPPASS
jgi:hypothetical protein